MYTETTTASPYHSAPTYPIVDTSVGHWDLVHSVALVLMSLVPSYSWCIRMRLPLTYFLYLFIPWVAADDIETKTD